MTRVQESASRRGLGRPPLDTWDTTAYGQQAGDTHPTGMHSCYYRPQRSCGQGNIFAPVCHSVHGGGVYLGACWDSTHPQSRHPPEQTRPWEQTPPRSRHPQSRHPPRADPPRADIPPEQTPQEQTPPWEQTPPGADTPQSRHPPEADPPGADTPQEQTPPSRSRPPEQTPPRSRPPRSRLRHTVNERPVRILLECILVVHFFRQECNTFIDFN